ncbi:MAG TPA: hypothetical protein DCM73_12440 [Clostridiales bacterium]|nr:hypothetical protein [Clostridiales bacterium]
MEEKSIGIPVSDYSTIIIFNNKETFIKTVKENPHIVALVGVNQEDEKDYPNVFIAGMVKAKGNA